MPVKMIHYWLALYIGCICFTVMHFMNFQQHTHRDYSQATTCIMDDMHAMVMMFTLDPPFKSCLLLSLLHGHFSGPCHATHSLESSGTGHRRDE